MEKGTLLHENRNNQRGTQEEVVGQTGTSHIFKYSNIKHGFCKCGAWLGDFGLEPTLELYIEHSMQVLDECWRVLRRDGTCWWNLGDSYAGSGQGWSHTEKQKSNFGSQWVKEYGFDKPPGYISSEINGLKPKDLCLVPYRFALAAQQRGWWIRSAITICKKNPMPESVRDRPTDATEMIFLMTKSANYWWDAEAVRQKGIDTEAVRDYISGNDSVFPMSSKIASQEVLFAPSLGQDLSEQKQPERNLQEVRKEEYESLAQNPEGAQVGKIDTSPLQSKSTGQTDAASVSENTQKQSHSESVGAIYGGKEISQKVPEVRKAKGGSSAIPSNEKIQDSSERISSNSEGQRDVGSMESQAAGEVDGGAMHPDSARMGGHQNETGESLSFLPEEKAADQRPYNSVDEGRDAYGGEHSGALSPVQFPERGGHNLYNYWLLNTAPYKEAHFATFSPEIPRLAILAGCPEKVCAKCGAGWVRILKPSEEYAKNFGANNGADKDRLGAGYRKHSPAVSADYKTLGWKPSCDCNAETSKGITLDPFAGSGTVVDVAIRSGRIGIGVELSKDYIELGKKRTENSRKQGVLI